jgi:predicted transcriptional regulator
MPIVSLRRCNGADFGVKICSIKLNTRSLAMDVATLIRPSNLVAMIHDTKTCYLNAMSHNIDAVNKKINKQNFQRPIYIY